MDGVLLERITVLAQSEAFIADEFRIVWQPGTEKNLRPASRWHGDSDSRYSA